MISKNLIITFFLVLCLQTSAKEESIATVIKLKGEVYKISPKGTQLSQVTKGEKLQNGMYIQTGEKSFAIIRNRFTKSVVTVGPRSDFLIGSSKKTKTSVLGLIRGKLRAKVFTKTKDPSVVVKTKTAAMGVRGTDFEVIHEYGSKSSILKTYEGQVDVVSEQSTLSKAEFVPEKIEEVTIEELNKPEKVVSVTKGMKAEIEETEMSELALSDEQLNAEGNQEAPKKEVKPIILTKIEEKERAPASQLETIAENETAWDKSELDLREKTQPRNYEIGLEFGVNFPEIRALNRSNGQEADIVGENSNHLKVSYLRKWKDHKWGASFMYQRINFEESNNLSFEGSGDLSLLKLGLEFQYKLSSKWTITPELIFGDYASFYTNTNSITMNRIGSYEAGVKASYELANIATLPLIGSLRLGNVFGNSTRDYTGGLSWKAGIETQKKIFDLPVKLGIHYESVAGGDSTYDKDYSNVGIWGAITW
ncbi:MAG: FecR family protein [Bacteriovoracaceae bacterium]